MIGLNSSWNIVNFRSGLIKSLVKHGYEVIGLAPFDSYSKLLKSINCRFIPVKIDTKGKNPLIDILLLIKYLCIFSREKPDVYLGFTVKPNVYGSIAAHLLGIPVINNIAGLGRVFNKKNIISRIVVFLYRISLSRSSTVFFQNNSDYRDFLNFEIVKKTQSIVLPGSGVDLVKFKPVFRRKQRQNIIFLLISRLLWEKGVKEFVESARILKKTFKDVDFYILGFTNKNDPQYVPLKQLKQWESDGFITYLGESDDVRVEIENADCVVLPTNYKEGTPRVLLEAAAMGKPLISTNTPGCRDIVKDGDNGFLCSPNSPRDLAISMNKFIQLDQEPRARLGLKSREIAEENFDEKLVVKKYLHAISFAFELKKNEISIKFC